MPKLYEYSQNNLNFKTSTEIGEITPIYWNRLYPGEKLKKLEFQNLTRMISPELPTMDNPYVEIFTFAVPKRILMPQFKNVASEDLISNKDLTLELTQENMLLLNGPLNKNATTDIEISFNISPYSYKNDYIHNPRPSADWPTGRNLFSRFGINNDFNTLCNNSTMIVQKWEDPNKTTHTLRTNINLMYNLAYWKIYESFFKNKQLESFKYDTLFKFFSVNGFEGLTLTNELLLEAWTSAIYVEDREAFKNFLRLINRVAITNTDNQFLNSLQLSNINTLGGFNWNEFNKFLGRNYSKNKMIIEQLQNGTEKDLLLKIWDANNQDKTQAKLIGYYKYDQKINQVIQTSGSTGDNNNLGETGGYSLTYNDSTIASDFEANEETFIISLAVPNYKLVINNTFEQQEWLNWSDMAETGTFVNGIFMPNCENSLQQSEPLLMYYDPATALDASKIKQSAGYVNGFDYLRYKKNLVGGQIPEYYSDWNYSANLYTDDSINMSLLKTPVEPFKKTLVSGTDALDSFIMDFNFKTEILRHIKPVYEIESKILENE